MRVHTEDGLSQRLLITVTSRRSRGRDRCQADFVRVDAVQSGTIPHRPPPPPAKQRGDVDGLNKIIRLRLFFVPKARLL